MSVEKGQLQRTVDAMWPSQDNSSSIDLIRDYAEKRDKKRAYVEIFRAYAARKLSIQAHFVFAPTLKLTWARDSYFPPAYGQATWHRLAPFFRLPGWVVWGRETVEVELRPFNDRQLNQDLEAICEKVNAEEPRLPDGRRLRFKMRAQGTRREGFAVLMRTPP